MKPFFTFLFLFVLHFSFAQTLQDSLLGYYPFNGNANDASGNNNHGVVHGAVLSADRFGNANSAYYFDGVDDIIRITDFNNDVMPSQNHFSASFWVKTTSPINGGMLGYSTACSSLTDNYYMIGLSYTSGFSHLVSRFMQLNPMPKVSDSYIIDGNWHLVTYTYDVGTARIYVDNQLLSTTQVSHPATNFTYPNFIDWTIGGYHINNCTHGTNYEGAIDEVRIYSKTLTAQEINTLVGQPSASFATNIQPCDLSVSFSNNSQNATSYQWDFGDGNTSTQTAPTHTYANAGTYNVVLTATNGGSQVSDTQTVQVSDNVTAAFSYPSTIYSNTPIAFTDNSIGATSWLWDFSNGTISTNQNPTIVFTNFGLTTVTLIASSGSNCSDTIVHQVNVRNNPTNTLKQFNEQNLKITPVPAKNNLNINFEFQGQKDLTIEIVNVLGQTVLKERFSNANNNLITQFDVSHLASGNYIVNITEYDNLKIIGQLSRQIIIQR